MTAVSFWLPGVGVRLICRFVWHIISHLSCFRQCCYWYYWSSPHRHHKVCIRYHNEPSCLFFSLQVTWRDCCSEPLACKIEYAVGANITPVGWLGFQVLYNLIKLEMWVLSRFQLWLCFLDEFQLMLRAGRKCVFAEETLEWLKILHMSPCVCVVIVIHW